MKSKEYQSIRLKQLEDQLSPERSISGLQRPSAGWLRAIRQALRLSAGTLASRIRQSPQSILQAEKSEAAGTITLKRLEAVAEAMGCRLVYAVVPKAGTITDLASAADRETIGSVQQSMTLEGQAVEHPDKLAG